MNASTVVGPKQFRNATQCDIHATIKIKLIKVGLLNINNVLTSSVAVYVALGSTQLGSQPSGTHFGSVLILLESR